MKQNLVIRNLPEHVFEKLKKKKDDDGFTDREWAEWLEHLVEDVHLVDSPAEHIQKNTKQLLETWMQNFAHNLPRIWAGKTIAELVPENPDQAPKGSAIVVGRGPSMYKYKQLELLAESDYKGTVISTDGALIDCVKRGVIPTYVISVDGNREKIWKYYDDPLIDKYGEKIKAILATCVAPNVAERAEKAKMDIYWFTALLDHPFKIENITAMLRMMSKTEKNPRGPPGVQCAGNAGATSWVFAHALFRCSPICLIGIDLGYPEDTKFEETSYWKGVMDAVGNVQVAASMFKYYYNPFFGTKAYTDPVFEHYRNGFLELVTEVPDWVKTIQCSVGTLFGNNIECMHFDDFLKKWKQ